MGCGIQQCPSKSGKGASLLALVSSELRAGSGFGLGVPAGFSVCVRSTPGKPKGYVEWQATCRHGTFKLDRTSKIAELLQKHAKCR